MPASCGVFAAWGRASLSVSLFGFQRLVPNDRVILDEASAFALEASPECLLLDFVQTLKIGARPAVPFREFKATSRGAGHDH